MRITLIILAVYRLSYLVVMESGPFGLMGKLRGVIFDKFGQSWVSDGLNCVLCVSFWFSFVGAFFTGENLILSWFGVAGAVAFIHNMLESD